MALIAGAAVLGACAPPGQAEIVVIAEQMEFGFESDGMIGTGLADILIATRRGVPFGPGDGRLARAGLERHCAARGQVFREDADVPGRPVFWEGEWHFAGACR